MKVYYDKDADLSLIKGKNLIPYDQLDNPTFRS